MYARITATIFWIAVILLLAYFAKEAVVAIERTFTPEGIAARDSGAFLPGFEATALAGAQFARRYEERFKVPLPGTENGAREFVRSFDEPIPAIEEAGAIGQSANPDWWVNSGGRAIFNDGVMKTMRGEVPEGDRWRREYARTNSEDTDSGRHPQNIFRLVQLGQWENFSQEARFLVVRHHESESVNRNQSNGLLLFNRYQSGDDLYYAGVRVDGYAVIKKKLDGRYETLAYERVFPGGYDRTDAPTLIPEGEWIGLRSVVRTLPDGSVSIGLYLREGEGPWRLVAEAVDASNEGSRPITEPGFAGIRTDFMDVEIDDFAIREISR